MIILSWNCRGLGQPQVVWVLSELIRVHRPDMVLLFETLVHINKLEEIRVKIQFEGCFSVDCVGHSGGIGVLWKSKAQVSLLNFSQNHVNLEVNDKERGLVRVTGFYGFPERQLTDCNLIDLPLVGYPYTWVRFKGKPNCVEERLDRALVNTDWLNIYPQVLLRNLCAPISDHSPLLLCTDVQEEYSGRRMFRFENKWKSEPTLKAVVQEAWIESSGGGLIDKLRTCSVALDKWGRDLALQFRRK
ncbi:hypothetical protein PTKIN_Ptkin10aG0146700 [Pterospermum kingtungense]